MKKYFLFLFFFFLPCLVSASSLQLEELKILNGKLSLPFDPLVNEYTVIVDKDIDTLKIEYKTEEDIKVTFLNNKNIENNSIVTIELEKEEKKVEYHLQVLKEEEENTLQTFHEEIELEKNTFLKEYKLYIIPSICLILIKIVKRILFPHKKKFI